MKYAGIASAAINDAVIQYAEQLTPKDVAPNNENQTGATQSGNNCGDPKQCPDLNDNEKKAEESQSKIKHAMKSIEDWLSENGDILAKKNKNDDLILRNLENTKRFRADFNNPSPHLNPHMHLEILDQAGEWITKRIWPFGMLPK